MVLNVFEHVAIKVERQNLYDDYCNVFLDQESEGIIVQLDVSPNDFNKLPPTIYRGPSVQIWRPTVKARKIPAKGFRHSFLDKYFKQARSFPRN